MKAFVHDSIGRRCAMMIRSFAVAVMLMAGVSRVFAAERLPSPIPLAEGTRWTYEATVKWTSVAGEGPSGIRTGRFQWTASIVKCIEGKNRRAAVIHAWPDELIGVDPAPPAGYGVLLESGNRLYRFRADNQLQAERLARELAAATASLPRSAEVYLDLSLRVGKRWGDPGNDLKREDGFYCWRVETQNEQPLQVKGVVRPKSAVVFTVAYRTLPDHQIVTITPGIGILSFQYEHHGTVATSDVRLIEFNYP